MIDALRLIIARSPLAAHDATQTIEAIRRNSPMAQTRYNHTCALAMMDTAAEFTPAERQLLAAGMDIDDGPTARQTQLRVRMSWEERAEIDRRAAAAGMDASEWTRHMLLS